MVSVCIGGPAVPGSRPGLEPGAHDQHVVHPGHAVHGGGQTLHHALRPVPSIHRRYHRGHHTRYVKPIIRCYLFLYNLFVIVFVSDHTCFSFQPVLHDWCNKGRGMCYPVYRMMHIKEPLLLIGKSSLCDCSRFPLSLSEWSFTICLTPYNCK